jgi:hypothetical protein
MTATAQPFSLVMGGPFHSLLSSLRLVGKDGLPTLGAAIILVVICWLPSALFSVGDYYANDNAAATTFFSDYAAQIRNLVAIGLLVMTERVAQLRLAPVVDQFEEAHLIHAESAEDFQTALTTADDRTSSAITEITLVVIVILIAVFGARLDLEYGGLAWDGRLVDGRVEYSAAGWWSHWIGKPLFQFLVLRWLWRFSVWSWLLLRISRMHLRLLAYHPDRCGGVGFLSVYPMVFSGVIFALSCVVAAQLVLGVRSMELDPNLLQPMIAAWIVFVLVVFVGPLAAFIRPLYRLREKTIFELGRIASEHHEAFQQKWIESEMSGGDLLGSADVSSATDLDPIASAPYTIKIIPVTLPMMVNLAFFAGAPMLAVVATQVPLREFFGYVLGTLL